MNYFLRRVAFFAVFFAGLRVDFFAVFLAVRFAVFFTVFLAALRTVFFAAGFRFAGALRVDFFFAGMLYLNLVNKDSTADFSFQRTNRERMSAYHYYHFLFC